MILKKDIVIDPNPILRTRCDQVTFPLNNNLKQTIINMREYIINSINPEISEKYDLQPAVGIAAPQINVNARMCCIYIEDEEHNPIIDLMMINPQIIAHSVSNIYLESGEACLSIKDEHPGYVHRPDYIKVRYNDLDGNVCEIKAYDFIAIAIQHEIDHLNGILFYDHIDKDNPYKIIPNSQPLS